MTHEPLCLSPCNQCLVRDAAMVGRIHLLLLILALASRQEASGSEECPDEWTRFQGNCYLIPEGKYSFGDAFAVCTNLSGHAVVITSPAEQEYVEEVFTGGVGRNLWTAGIRVSPENRDSSFRWMTGQPVSFTRWARNQPDNHGAREYCILLSSGPIDTGKWHDVDCKQAHAVLCQKALIGGREKPQDEERAFVQVLRDMYARHHPVPQSDFRFYNPFLYPLAAVSSMFLVMLIVFLILNRFLASTSLDEKPLRSKDSHSGVVNKAFLSA